jgi:hypothetical protein
LSDHAANSLVSRVTGQVDFHLSASPLVDGLGRRRARLFGRGQVGVAVKDAAGFVAADSHRGTLGHTRPNQHANFRATQVVESQAVRARLPNLRDAE